MSDDLVNRLREGPMSFHEARIKMDAAATALEEARAEIERLRAEVYVPGQWRCAKCKFTLQLMNLNANTGTVTARDNAGDKCPNCNSPLWRATWKQDAHEMLDRATEQMERVKVAESELSTLRARVREVVGPFAHPHLSRMATGNIEGDRSIVFGRDEAELTLGNFRAARQLMEEVK